MRNFALTFDDRRGCLKMANMAALTCRPEQCRLSWSSVRPAGQIQRAVVVEDIRQTSLQFNELHTPPSLAVCEHTTTYTALHSASYPQREYTALHSASYPQRDKHRLKLSLLPSARQTPPYTQPPTLSETNTALHSASYPQRDYTALHSVSYPQRDKHRLTLSLLPSAGLHRHSEQ